MRGFTELDKCAKKRKNKKGERYLKCTKGGGSVAFHIKITITGVMQETKEITMAIANLKIFPICLSKWFWRQDNRSFLFLFFSLIVHAKMLGTTARTTTGMRMKAIKVPVKNPFSVFMWSDAGPYFKLQYISFW